MPREQGTQVYEKIVRKKVDPALLEWAGGNDFEARVYPIPPRSLKRVVLVYEQTLLFEGGKAHLSLPLPERPVPQAEAHLYVDEEKAQIEALSLAGADARAAIGEKQGSFRAARLDLSGRAFEGALSLSMRPPDARAQFIVGGGDAALPGRFVFGRLFPDVPDREIPKPTGEAVFVVDTSLSEDGDRAQLAGQMLEAVLTFDETISRFNVMLFDVRAKWLFPAGLRENTPAARSEALRRLTAIEREGATNFQAALELLDATEWLPAEATAFLLSDGQITWGESSSRRLLAAARRAGALRWIGYRFGEAAVNRELLQALTRRNGQVVSCLSADQVAAAARAHRRSLLSVESIRVEGVELHDYVVRGNPQAIFPGQEIQIAGRALGKADEAAIVIDGLLDGRPVRLRHPFRGEGRDMLAPRAWAELHVERLLSFGSAKLDRLTIALSQHFGLTNRLASLLVLEADEEYPRYEIAHEQVSLAEVEAEAKRALTQADVAEAGLDLSPLSPLARELIASLRDSSKPSGLAALELRPLAGGRRRTLAELFLRERRARRPDDVLPLFELSRVRRDAGDALGAVRAISSVVELRPQDPEALRGTGFVLLAQGFARPAAQVLGRLRGIRSFEVQSFIEEASALEEAGMLSGAARNYELVLARKWERHAEVVEAARQHYMQLLTRLQAGSGQSERARQLVAERLAQLKPGLQADLQVTMHWNVDDIDIDLWVRGPGGEVCDYRNPRTASGGRLFWDTRTGYGPEIFQQYRVRPGDYVAKVHYFANNSEQWAVPAVALGILDEYPWDPARHRRRFAVELLTDQGRSVRDLFVFTAAGSSGLLAGEGPE
ncbi:MAG: VWA domain-containing protein [Myxococcales bacterium]